MTEPARWICRGLLVALLVSTAGCSALAVRLGFRIRLDSLPVTAVSASMVDKKNASVSALGPGQAASLVVVATTQNGKQYPSMGAGNGKVSLDNYTIESTVVQVSKNGSVSLPQDPRVSEGKVGHLHIVTIAHPNVVADVDIPIRYDIAFTADYSGTDGRAGFDGTDGTDGTAGVDAPPAEADVTTGIVGIQTPGGAGSDGGRGGDGSDGEDGIKAPPVHAWIRLEPGTTPLLQIKVESGNRQSLYIVNPNGGTLKILANGGHGGRGGSGGRGGRGGQGGNGVPPGMSGTDGLSGMGGRPGRGGAGGTITLTVDPAAQSYMSCVSWSNRSGDGFAGPAPTTTVAPVAALW